MQRLRSDPPDPDDGAAEGKGDRRRRRRRLLDLRQEAEVLFISLGVVWRAAPFTPHVTVRRAPTLTLRDDLPDALAFGGLEMRR